MVKDKNPKLLDIIVQNPEEIKDYLPQFLKEWKKFYPDQIKTHVEALVYTKKISKFEAMKTLEDEITEQVNVLIDRYHYFPEPFKIYSFLDIPNVKVFLRDLRENEYFMFQRNFPELWVWSKDALHSHNEMNLNNEYLIAGTIFKRDVNWTLTLLKNCEFTYGLDEKEIIIFHGAEIQIIEIKGHNFFYIFKR